MWKRLAPNDLQWMAQVAHPAILCLFESWVVDLMYWLLWRYKNSIFMSVLLTNTSCPLHWEESGFKCLNGFPTSLDSGIFLFTEKMVLYVHKSAKSLLCVNYLLFINRLLLANLLLCKGDIFLLSVFLKYLQWTVFPEVYMNSCKPVVPNPN